MKALGGRLRRKVTCGYRRCNEEALSAENVLFPQ